MFPQLGDPGFQGTLAQMKEFAVHAAPQQPIVSTRADFLKRVGEQCDPTKFERSMHQHLIEHYLSIDTPYRGLLLYHGVGVGKTCASIAVAESLLSVPPSSGTPSGAKIWVVVPKALKRSYEEQIFDVTRLVNVKEQCTADTYLKLIPGHAKLDEDALSTKIRALIKGRYEFFTYEGFAIRVAELEEQGRTAAVFQDKLLIIDEAHNIRLGDEKQIEEPLRRLLTVGTNNRLLLLSATPMYNDPEEIFWLLSLLALNDKRPVFPSPPSLPRLFNDSGIPNQASFDLLKQLAQEYISYVKGVNPFVFAVRLSPVVNGTQILDYCPKYARNGSIIPAYQATWFKSISDGIVTTPIGSSQSAAILKGFGKTDAETPATSIALLQQANNVVYKNGRLGEKGFKATFQATDDDKPYQYRYAKPDMPILQPGADYLGKYAAKVNRIIEFIQKSKGIVMIYSQYVWSGVVPMAAALEHIGFTRYKSRPLLTGLPAIATATATRAPGTYAILSGDRNLMGPSIDSLKAAINARDNFDGSKIKVILLSPVAGEGFSFRNIREVHILDPWFHLNRNDQVIGRAIRTCSHTDLPLEDRNVTVFLHSTMDGERETADLRAYRIASQKADHIQMVDDVIIRYAMDCPLQTHLNYIPQEVFRFDVTLNSSQGALVPFHFGDSGAPARCAFADKAQETLDSANWSRATYKHLLPTLTQRLRRYLEAHPATTTFEQCDLMAAMGTSNTPSLREPVLNVLANNPDLVVEHMGHYIRSGVATALPKAHRIKLVPQKAREYKALENLGEYQSFVDILPSDKEEAAIVLYSKLDSKLWHSMAKLLVKAVAAADPVLETPGFKRLMTLLIAQGLIVKTRTLYGYVDIFVIPTAIAVFDAAADATTFRDATQDEAREIYKKYVPTPLPKTGTLYGFFAPHTFAKNNSTTHLEFKLFLPDVPMSGSMKTGAREKRGVVCTSNKKEALENMLALPPSKANTKESLCTSLAVKLLKEGRLFLPPILKPST